jgi:hypothetical protein
MMVIYDLGVDKIDDGCYGEYDATECFNGDSNHCKRKYVYHFQKKGNLSEKYYDEILLCKLADLIISPF